MCDYLGIWLNCPFPPTQLIFNQNLPLNSITVALFVFHSSNAIQNYSLLAILIHILNAGGWRWWLNECILRFMHTCLLQRVQVCVYLKWKFVFTIHILAIMHIEYVLEDRIYVHINIYSVCVCIYNWRQYVCIGTSTWDVCVHTQL